MIRALAAALLGPVAAQAAVVGVVEASAGRLELHDTKGHCQGEALYAVFVPANQKADRILGCWVVGGGLVQVAYLDGDASRFPAGIVRKPEHT